MKIRAFDSGIIRPTTHVQQSMRWENGGVTGDYAMMVRTALCGRLFTETTSYTYEREWSWRGDNQLHHRMCPGCLEALAEQADSEIVDMIRKVHT